ncbi:MAG TPA: GNAT family N-acetyltransferase [Phnomibacter sp.]|nr:GNAT family N-acetyltransferase [Phnomibacter sp.]
MNPPPHNEAIIIRHAGINDVPALAAMHVETFNETHGFNPNGPTVELRSYQWQKMFEAKDDSWFCLVLENASAQLIGFAKGQPYQHADLPDYAGELNKIYLLRRYHRTGLGKQLICKVAKEFIERHINSMLLFGDTRNPSNGFYEHMGAEKLRSKQGEFHGGYGWKNLQVIIEHCQPNWNDTAA